MTRWLQGKKSKSKTNTMHVKFSIRACHRHFCQEHHELMTWDDVCFETTIKIAQSILFIHLRPFLRKHQGIFQGTMRNNVSSRRIHSSRRVRLNCPIDPQVKWLRACKLVFFYGPERSKPRFPFTSQTTWWDSLKEHYLSYLLSISKLFLFRL